MCRDEKRNELTLNLRLRRDGIDRLGREGGGRRKDRGMASWDGYREMGAGTSVREASAQSEFEMGVCELSAKKPKEQPVTEHVSCLNGN